MPTTNDYFLRVGAPGTATTLSAPGYTAGGTTINVASTGNFPNDTAVIFGIDTVSLSSGTQVRNANSYCVFVGIVTSATSIGSVTLLSGTPQNYAAAATTRVYITVSSVHTNRLISGILQHANQDGSLKTTAVQNALGLGTSSLNGWNVLGATPSSVTANGNRSYTMTFNGSDQTGTLSPGMRFRTTRTVAAPTQCTSLNGTTQFYSKTSPAGMTFTNNFVVSAWVKLSSYQAGTIVSRYNGTSGWKLEITATGQLSIAGFNGGVGNVSYAQPYQSLPLNKWVHVAAQLDMSTFTATPTTTYFMLDGLDVPCFVQRGGTNPTALIQAGNLEIGSQNAGTVLFPGKIAQVAIYGAKVTQATINASKDQTLAGTETSLISAYSFNNTVNDLNTTNANNLTANGSAVATNADSPYGGQADGTISSTLDYGIVQKATFSTNTTVVVQVAEGCTIPTGGGVAAVAYSPNKVPYGFPGQAGKWGIQSFVNSQSTSTTNGAWINLANQQILIPIGEWKIGYTTSPQATASTTVTIRQTLSTANNTESDIEFTAEQYLNVNGARIGSNFNKYRSRTASIATTYYLNTRTDNGTSPTMYNIDAAGSLVEAVNDYL